MKRKLAVVYTALVGVPLATLLVVLALGQNIAPTQLTPAQAGETAGIIRSQPAPAGVTNPAFIHPALSMAQIALIILVSRSVGSLIERIRQPRVIGEVLAGTKAGRESAEEITLFKSVGVAVEDIVAADLVWRNYLASQ